MQKSHCDKLTLTITIIDLINNNEQLSLQLPDEEIEGGTAKVNGSLFHLDTNQIESEGGYCCGGELLPIVSPYKPAPEPAPGAAGLNLVAGKVAKSASGSLGKTHLDPHSIRCL